MQWRNGRRQRNNIRNAAIDEPQNNNNAAGFEAEIIPSCSNSACRICDDSSGESKVKRPKVNLEKTIEQKMFSSRLIEFGIGNKK